MYGCAKSQLGGQRHAHLQFFHKINKFQGGGGIRVWSGGISLPEAGLLIAETPEVKA